MYNNDFESHLNKFKYFGMGEICFKCQVETINLLGCKANARKSF